MRSQGPPHGSEANGISLGASAPSSLRAPPRRTGRTRPRHGDTNRRGQPIGVKKAGLNRACARNALSVLHLVPTMLQPFPPGRLCCSRARLHLRMCICRDSHLPAVVAVIRYNSNPVLFTLGLLPQPLHWLTGEHHHTGLQKLFFKFILARQWWRSPFNPSPRETRVRPICASLRLAWPT